VKVIIVAKPKLYIHVVLSTHFLRWEVPEFAKNFVLVDRPASDVALLAFGPDALEEASTLPALKRFAVLFPGFGFNPVYNQELRERQISLFGTHFEMIFINPGPLEIAYSDAKNIELCQPSVDVNLVGFNRYRRQIKSLVHVSNDGPQKDWQRSEEIMRLTGMKYLVYPPRDTEFLQREVRNNNRANRLRKLVGLNERAYPPYGYVDHQKVIKKYNQYDGFVHVASDVKHFCLLDGKYTASLIEAGITGAILFWHDTFGLGNNLDTVFNLSVEPREAAKEVIYISKHIDVYRHSQLTRQEMIETFNPRDSVRARAVSILAKI
jgi:hypothetical protein